MVFTINYGLKAVSFACKDDKCFKAIFVDKNDVEHTYCKSREEVEEHARKMFTKDYYEKNIEGNKVKIVRHFHNMACKNFAITHPMI